MKTTNRLDDVARRFLDQKLETIQREYAPLISWSLAQEQRGMA